MYRYKDLYFRFSADTCTSTFVTANIFPWYLLIRENFANEAVPVFGRGADLGVPRLWYGTRTVPYPT